MTSDCEEILDRLPAYQDGELDGPQKKRVEGHLAACEACRREEKSLRKAWGDFRLAHQPGALPPELKRNPYRHPADEPRRRAFFRVFRIRWALAPAFAAVVFAVIFQWPVSCPGRLQGWTTEKELSAWQDPRGIELVLARAPGSVLEDFTDFGAEGGTNQ